jgi:hypothetical protein
MTIIARTWAPSEPVGFRALSSQIAGQGKSLFDELVPRLTTNVEDAFAGFEDTV